MASASSTQARQQVNASLAALIQATAGAGGGVWSMAMLFPLDTLKTLIQAGKTRSPKTLEAFQQVREEDGALSLYRGLGAKASETALKNFIYFYAYEILVKIAKARGMKMTTLNNLIVGYVAGVANMVCIMPLEVVSTRLQVKPNSFWKATREIIDEEGAAGLYSGFKFNVLLCLNPAIVNTVFDIIKKRLVGAKPAGSKFLTPLEAFALGAFAKCVATILTYPLVRIKTVLQTGLAKENEENCKSESLWTFYFRGLGPSLVKTASQAALMYMAKERIAVITKLLLKSAVHFVRPEGRRSKIKVLGGKPLA
ncbi:unnamed protein product [Amoebophrya sp. A25]|nr:unnamed protein product [Amoebophrya sp. A25]|eukprot:GSA25T00019809001.1